MPDHFTDAPIRNTPCPICQSTSYQWGGAGLKNTNGILFWPITEGFFDRMAANPLRGVTWLRLCESCGNLQHFIERE